MMMRIVAALVVVVMAVVGCGVESGDRSPAAFDADAASAASVAPEMTGNPGNPGVQVMRSDQGNPVPQGYLGRAVQEPIAAPAERAAMDQAAPVAAPAAPVAPAAADEADEFRGEQAALVAQNRIIVRTVNMEIVVDDVSAGIAAIGRAAEAQGGWVVKTERASTHTGFVAVRVPAAMLDGFVRDSVAGAAREVRSQRSDSKDVTDEYYDLSARVKSLQETEAALVRLLDRAEKVEDALAVQRELARLQVEIEAHLGRIKLLEETSAFSLVNVRLNVAPVAMRVNAGGDKAFSVGELARFQATFAPPEGIDEFTIVWEFGDGAAVTTHGSVQTTTPGQRISGAVTHSYENERDSPYIAQVRITGTGKAGLAEGEDTFIATVTRAPVIEVFADDVRNYEGGNPREGETREYSAIFTRPEGLTNLRYEWDFGDGSRVVAGTPAEGETRVSASYAYENYRPIGYTVTLTISADSAAGRVEGVSAFDVYVEESQGLVVGGWSAGDNARSAVRALSGVAQGVGTLAIWLAIFSPVWLVGGAVALGVVWLGRRLGRRRVGEAALARQTGQGAGDARQGARDTQQGADGA